MKSGWKVQRGGFWRRLLRSSSGVAQFPPPHIAGDSQSRQVRSALTAFLGRDEGRFRRLFLAGESLTWEDVERPWLQVLDAAGYVTMTARGEARPCVRVFFLDDLLVATDLLTHTEEDQVFSLMDEQVFLVRAMEVRQGEGILELCLGSGVNAIAAARRGAARVVGVDVNERALAFAKANAAVNLSPERGDAVLEVLHGNLFDPLTAHDSFDLIVVNPPFEPVPPNTPHFLHSHGGEDGLDVVRALLPGVRQRLRPGGRFEMFTWTPTDASSEWVTALVLATLPEFRVELRRVDSLPLEVRLATFRNRPNYREWCERLLSRGATHVCGIHVRASQDGPAGLVRLDATDDIRACDATLARWR